MLVTNPIFLLLFLAIGLLLIVDAAHAPPPTSDITYSTLNPNKTVGSSNAPPPTSYITYSSSNAPPPTSNITYSALNPNKTVGYVGSSGGDITVGSSVTTDDASSWISSSGRFSFGFYRENDNFFVGIQLLAFPSETVVVWTARPDLRRFSKDAFLNFTDKGLFVTPNKEEEAFALVNFSSTATSADILDNGNFVVYGSTNSNIYKNSTQVSLATSTTAAVKRGTAYTGRGCIYKCNTSSDDDIIIWRSFDFPTDTILGNQILPCDYNLTSSAGKTDHSIGNYVLNLPCGAAYLISYKLNSTDKNWDTGTSSGDYISLNLGGDGRLYLASSGGNEKDLFDYKSDKTITEEIYRATLDPDNVFRLYALNLDTNKTTPVNEIPYYKDSCQAKDICGINSYCLLANSNAKCNCMPGFEYINPDSQFAGCRRNKTVPSCISLGGAADAAAIFSMETVENITGMDDLAYSVVSTGSQEECNNACLNDCICDAASFIDQMCSKLKLPLTSGRKDDNYPRVTFIKLAVDQPPAAGPRRRREINSAGIFISAAAAISIWIVVIAAFVGAYWLLFARFREEWRKWELALTEEIAPRYFSYEELLKRSNEFNHPLGKGGHGTVFRAELPIGDRTVSVALKKLHGAEMEGEREFQTEMSLIGRAYHANLVRLLGFCHDGPSRIIAYELMSRGSLANHIFESRGRRPSMERRMSILIDAARGIHYLHSECDTKIIHRDIKPENILISENWTAKIADFGLAKLLNRNQTRAATRTLAAGTEGYVAPECEQVFDEMGETQVTEKADVYSYGIVVLETICCKRNREVRLSLCELVRKSYEANDLSKLVDGEEVEAFELEKLVKVGLLCVQDDPNSRPFMEDVVMMLEGYIDVPTPLPTVPLSL